MSREHVFILKTKFILCLCQASASHYKMRHLEQSYFRQLDAKQTGYTVKSGALSLSAGLDLETQELQIESLGRCCEAVGLGDG